MVFHSSEFNFNRELIDKMNFSVFNDSSGMSFYNLSFTTKKDFAVFMVCFEMNIKSEKHIRDYDVRVSQVNLNVCNLNKMNLIVSSTVNYIVGKIERYSNFRLQCPLKKGDFYIKNSPAPDEGKTIAVSKFFAEFFFSQWQVTITVRMKLTEKSAAARGFGIKVRGTTVKG